MPTAPSQFLSCGQVYAGSAAWCQGFSTNWPCWVQLKHARHKTLTACKLATGGYIRTVIKHGCTERRQLLPCPGYLPKDARGESIQRNHDGDTLRPHHAEEVSSGAAMSIGCISQSTTSPPASPAARTAGSMAITSSVAASSASLAAGAVSLPAVNNRGVSPAASSMGWRARQEGV